MKIERYVNGKKVTMEQMKKYTLKNKTIDATIEKVIKRATV